MKTETSETSETETEIEKGFYITTGKCIVEITKTDAVSFSNYPVIGTIIKANKASPEYSETAPGIEGLVISYTPSGEEFRSSTSWLDLDEKINIEEYPEYFI